MAEKEGYQLEDIDNIKKLREITEKEIQVTVNRIFYDEDKNDLVTYLKELSVIKNISVVFADMMVYKIIEWLTCCSRHRKKKVMNDIPDLLSSDILLSIVETTQEDTPKNKVHAVILGR